MYNYYPIALCTAILKGGTVPTTRQRGSEICCSTVRQLPYKVFGEDGERTAPEKLTNIRNAHRGVLTTIIGMKPLRATSLRSDRLYMQCVTTSLTCTLLRRSLCMLGWALPRLDSEYPPGAGEKSHK